MKKLICFFSMFLIASCTGNVAVQQNNTLTAKEKKEGWTLLFDGKTIEGWRKYNSDEMAVNWVIEDEAMNLTRGEQAGCGQSGSIIFSTKKYSNFELSIDWKIEKEGNSGVFYYILEHPDLQYMHLTAPEIQILDNWNAGDNRYANHLAGSLYDMIPALPSNAKPAMEWNTLVVRIKDGKVTHTQNGVKVVEYELWTPEWYALVANSKFKNWEGFNQGPAKEGYIGLQDHGYYTWFRNIKIREL